MSANTNPRHRVWSYAAASAVVMLLGPTLAASISWFTGTGRDPDMTGVHELIFFLLMLWTLPAIALAFGVIAPMVIALDRLVRGRTTRIVNVMLGTMLGIPALVAVAFATRALSVWSAHPERALILFIVFAVPCAIAALGMRHRFGEKGAAPSGPIFQD